MWCVLSNTNRSIMFQRLLCLSWTIPEDCASFRLFVVCPHTPHCLSLSRTFNIAFNVALSHSDRVAMNCTDLGQLYSICLLYVQCFQTFCCKSGDTYSLLSLTIQFVTTSWSFTAIILHFVSVSSKSCCCVIEFIMQSIVQ